MKLTKLAQELKESKENNTELTQEQQKLSSCMGSESFGYALYEGGYLIPEQWIEGEDLKKLKEAIALVGDFKSIIEKLHDEI